MKDLEQFRGLTMRDYLAARLDQLSSTKSLDEVAREIGYSTARPLEMMLAGKTRVPIDRLLPLSRILGAPLLPLFKMTMAQFGPSMAELAAAICDCVEKAQPTPDRRTNPSADATPPADDHSIQSSGEH